MKKLTILFVFSVLFGCSPDDSTVENNPNPSNPHIAENVVVIMEETSTLLSSVSDLNNGKYIFEFSNDVPEISSDDIIVGDVGQGFLRNVTSIRQDGNKLTIQTSQATMDDLFNDATVQFTTDISNPLRNVNLVKETLDIKYLHNGIKMSENGLQYDFSNVVLYDGVATFTITKGTATFTPNFAFQADYTLLNGLDFLEFGTENSSLFLNAELDVTINSTLELSGFSKVLVDYDKKLLFMVGGAPVVVVINTQLVAEVSANTEASISWLSNWTNTFNTTTGVKYENRAWTGNFEVDSDLAVNSMSLGGQASLTQNLTVIPKVSVRFYGIIGPYCEPKLTEDFTINLASPSLDWDANLKTGLDLRTGVDVTIFGKTLADFSTRDVYEDIIYKAPIALEIVSGNEQSGTLGQLLNEPLVVKVTDDLGNPMPLVPVYFTVTDGNGTVNNPIVVTDANGFAKVLWILGNDEGPQSVAVTFKNAEGSEVTSVSFNARTGVQRLFSFVYEEGAIKLAELNINDFSRIGLIGNFSYYFQKETAFNAQTNEIYAKANNSCEYVKLNIVTGETTNFCLNGRYGEPIIANNRLFSFVDEGGYIKLAELNITDFSRIGTIASFNNGFHETTAFNVQTNEIYAKWANSCGFVKINNVTGESTSFCIDGRYGSPIIANKRLFSFVDEDGYIKLAELNINDFSRIGTIANFDNGFENSTGFNVQTNEIYAKMVNSCEFVKVNIVTGEITKFCINNPQGSNGPPIITN